MLTLPAFSRWNRDGAERERERGAAPNETNAMSGLLLFAF